MAKRTILRFEINNDIWPIVESWASELGYQEKTKGNTWRRYQQAFSKFVLILAVQKMIEVHQERSKVEIQGWISSNILIRIISLFTMPAELDLGPGFRGRARRIIARRDLNILLQSLGQPTVK